MSISYHKKPILSQVARHNPKKNIPARQDYSAKAIILKLRNIFLKDSAK